MLSASKPSWQQVTALVSLSASGTVTGFSFVPHSPADLMSPTSLPVRLMALERSVQPAATGDAALRSAIVNVASYYLRMAQGKTPAEMEAIIWQHDSVDGVDHGESCAAFASLTLELAAQVVGQQSWVTGGTSYPWPLHKWADVRVDPNPSSPNIVSVLQDAQAHGRWHPLGDGYQPQPGDWVLFDGHVEVVTKYADGTLYTIGGDSLPNFSVNAHEYPGPLAAQGVVGFVNNGDLPTDAPTTGGAGTASGNGATLPGSAATGRASADSAAVPGTSGTGTPRLTAGPCRGRTPPGGPAQPYPGRAAQPYPGRAAQPYPGRAAQPYPGRAAQPYPRAAQPYLAQLARQRPAAARLRGRSTGRAAQGWLSTLPARCRPFRVRRPPTVPRPAPRTRPMMRLSRGRPHRPAAGHCRCGMARLCHGACMPATGASRRLGLPPTPMCRERTGSSASAVTAQATAAGAAAIPGVAQRQPGAATPYQRHRPQQATTPVQDTSTQQAFIDEIAPGAMATQRKYGVPAAVTIAQAIDESGWGQSLLASQDHNLFGIKGDGPAGADWQSTQEYENGQWVTINAAFRVYNNVTESIDDHAELLATSGYYTQAMADRNDPNEFANALTGVYATNPDYGSDLIQLMQQYGLYRYDAAATGPRADAAATGAGAEAETGTAGAGAEQARREQRPAAAAAHTSAPAKAAPSPTSRRRSLRFPGSRRRPPAHRCPPTPTTSTGPAATPTTSTGPAPARGVHPQPGANADTTRSVGAAPSPRPAPTAPGYRAPPPRRRRPPAQPPRRRCPPVQPPRSPHPPNRHPLTTHRRPSRHRRRRAPARPHHRAPRRERGLDRPQRRLRSRPSHGRRGRTRPTGSRGPGSSWGPALATWRDGASARREATRQTRMTSWCPRRSRPP